MRLLALNVCWDLSSPKTSSETLETLSVPFMTPKITWFLLLCFIFVRVKNCLLFPQSSKLIYAALWVVTFSNLQSTDATLQAIASIMSLLLQRFIHAPFFGAKVQTLTVRNLLATTKGLNIPNSIRSPSVRSVTQIASSQEPLNWGNKLRYGCFLEHYNLNLFMSIVNSIYSLS